MRIHALGTSLPARSISQSDSADIAATLCCENDQHRRLLKTLYRRTGVKSRHSVLLESESIEESPSGHETILTGNGSQTVASAVAVAAPVYQQTFYRAATGPHDRGPTTGSRAEAYNTHAAKLAIEAGYEALSQCDVSAESITHLVTISCTGFQAPGVDIALIQALGLAATVSRTNVGFMGCHGAMNGLRIAKAFTDSDPNARVLLVAVELCSLHQQYGWNHDRIVANALFADGAAAIVASSGGSESNEALIELKDSFSLIIPNTEAMMSWEIGDHGYEMFLSAEVPDIIRRSTSVALSEWLSKLNLSLAEIRSWAIHPGGPRILDACSDALNLQAHDLDASRAVLSRCGNMSSPTVLFVLQELLASRCDTPTLMLGFGPGLAMEAALFV